MHILENTSKLYILNFYLKYDMYSGKWATHVKFLKCVHKFFTTSSSKGKPNSAPLEYGSKLVTHFYWLESDERDSVTSEVRSKKHDGSLLALKALALEEARYQVGRILNWPYEEIYVARSEASANSLWVNQPGSLQQPASRPAACLQPPETLSQDDPAKPLLLAQRNGKI